MIVCESALLTILFVLLSVSSYTDCKSSRINNSILLISAISSIITDAIYYYLCASRYAFPFLINVGLISLISILLYAYHIWAAGDSKLLIAVALCIPGRFLTFWNIGTFPGFFIIVVTFLSAFLYVIIETIFLDIKEKDLFHIYRYSFSAKEYAVSFAFMTAATTIISAFLSVLIPQQYFRHTPLIMAFNFLIVLSLLQVRNHFSTRTLLLAAVIMWAVLGIMSVFKLHIISFSFNVRSWFYVLLIMLGWSFAEKYNYQTIPTRDVRAGQILAASTIFRFKPSRIHGLPSGTTEDLRSRLTNSEAESVHRWEKSALGQPYVVIVRKIPFAVFISIGTIVFLMIEVAMQW